MWIVIQGQAVYAPGGKVYKGGDVLPASLLRDDFVGLGICREFTPPVEDPSPVIAVEVEAASEPVAAIEAPEPEIAPVVEAAPEPAEPVKAPAKPEVVRPQPKRGRRR